MEYKFRTAIGTKITRNSVRLENKRNTSKSDTKAGGSFVLWAILKTGIWKMYAIIIEKPNGNTTKLPTWCKKSHKTKKINKVEIQNFNVKPKKKFSCFI